MWQRFMAWLCAPEPPKTVAPSHALHSVRANFLVALTGLGGDDVDALRLNIAAARSLRDLWHLRAVAYRTIQTHRNASQAEQTLKRLDRCFPQPV